ncbi:hypothetical protein ACIBCM_33610 [Streptomyces sp. NPDC051018]|uniref:hypothetical protein n=1 Tax=Streptomyces sp. NPDC051018 TaxID=3365639 RepID=UPI00378D6E3E
MPTFATSTDRRPRTSRASPPNSSSTVSTAPLARGTARSPGSGPRTASSSTRPGAPRSGTPSTPSGTLVRLDLSYPEYLETLLLTRGLHGWQNLFADPHDPGFPEYFHLDVGPRLDFIARAFPHDDFSALRARYEAFTRAREEG